MRQPPENHGLRHRSRSWVTLATFARLACTLTAVAACTAPPRAAPPGASTDAGPGAAIPGAAISAGRTDYGDVARSLSAFIDRQMDAKELPAVSIALVDDQRTVWAEAFGWAEPQDSVAAAASTVYRVGSVSKLFTDIAVMQLVERGEIDLDAPITRYLPEFRPENPFGTSITLRQLMSHRAGLVREPPVGNYFETSEPTLAATVGSLNETALVYAPETRIKYSNAGIATVGYVLERLAGEPFAEYVQRAVLTPLGMSSSAFWPRPDLESKLATSYMCTLDGRTFEAPTFQLGMAPAGSMYSTVEDLARFISVLFAGGRTPGGQVLEPATLEAMWRPQFADPGATSGYGIGFGLSTLDGHRMVGHGGAIYGFATQLSALPDQKLGVVVVTSLDITNAVMDRIAERALRLMIAARAGESLPRAVETTPIAPARSTRAKALEGRYGTPSGGIDLLEFDGRLYAEQVRGGSRVELRARGDTLIVDGRLGFGARMLPLTGDGASAGDVRALVIGDDTLRRVGTGKPEPAPARWDGLIGEYGWDHNTLYILEKEGKLHALIEWFFLYPLEEVSRDVYRFPAYGLYDGETLVFERDAAGRALRVETAEVVFERRAVGAEDGETFRITPMRPVEELRRAALAATPPVETGDFREPELVELTTLDPTIKLDIRYASTNNFMGAVFYAEPRAFLQRPAAEALVRAHRGLREHGYGLLIHDAYRPWYVTKMFWDATPAEQKLFVANPAEGSRHNRGAAVDLTLYDLETGRPVEMVSGYDEFSPRAFPRYPGETARQRWHRELLREAMEAEGFDVYEWEWWHFDYGEWRNYPILNLTFDEIP